MKPINRLASLFPFIVMSLIVWGCKMSTPRHYHLTVYGADTVVKPTEEKDENSAPILRERLEEINDIGGWRIIDILDRNEQWTGDSYIVKEEYGYFRENSIEVTEKTLRVQVTVKRNSEGGKPHIYVDFDEYDNGSYEESCYGNRWTVECNGTSFKGDWGRFERQGSNAIVDTDYLFSIEKPISFFAGVGYSKIYRFTIDPYGYRRALIESGIVKGGK